MERPGNRRQGQALLNRGSFGSFADLFGLFLDLQPAWPLTLVPTGSLRSAQFAVFPGLLRVRLWQRRDPSKHADKPNRVSQSLGLIDAWPVWSGRVRICFGRSANTSDLRRD